MLWQYCAHQCAARHDTWFRAESLCVAAAGVCELSGAQVPHHGHHMHRRAITMTVPRCTQLGLTHSHGVNGPQGISAGVAWRAVQLMTFVCFSWALLPAAGAAWDGIWLARLVLLAGNR